MKLPDMVETKLRDREAILLQKPLRQEEGGMTIHYHCEGKPIGETVFPYTPEDTPDWFHSRADCVSQAAEAVKSTKT